LQCVGCDKFALANAGTPFTDVISNQFLRLTCQTLQEQPVTLLEMRFGKICRNSRQSFNA
jgi:hypothetical protein